MTYIKPRDLEVSRIGLGAVGMSHGCTDSGTDEAESIRIPGTKGVRQVEENVAADGIRLTAEQVDKLSSLPPAAGETHTEAGRQILER